MSSALRNELLLFGLALGFALLGFGLPFAGFEDWAPHPRPPGALRVVTWNVGQGGGSRQASAQELTRKNHPPLIYPARDSRIVFCP